MATLSPLNNTRVFPDGWEAHHAPVAAATMTAPCVIFRESGEEEPYPMPDGWTNLVPLVTGIHCRLQEQKRELSPLVVGQPTETRGYLITIPKHIDVELRGGEGGDIVEVEGRHYRIKQVLHGSVLWEWDLMCTDNLTQNQVS